jgi:hypothetical protein
MPPIIAGGVDGDEWQAAAGRWLHPVQPQRGEPSELKTEARGLYDAGHLYMSRRRNP